MSKLLRFYKDCFYVKAQIPQFYSQWILLAGAVSFWLLDIAFHGKLRGMHWFVKLVGGNRNFAPHSCSSVQFGDSLLMHRWADEREHPHWDICAVTTSLKPFPWLTRANADSRRLWRSALLVLAMDQPLKKSMCLCGLHSAAISFSNTAVDQQQLG